jgi:hypothetical protein
VRVGLWIVRRHAAGGDIDTLHATYGEARRAEREAIEAARTHYGLAYRITLFRTGGRK